jgi:hypothetical protein
MYASYTYTFLWIRQFLDAAAKYVADRGKTNLAIENYNSRPLHWLQIRMCETMYSRVVHACT